MSLQIHGQHDGQGIGDDGGHVVAVNMSRHVGPLLLAGKTDGQAGQSQGTDQKSEGIAGNQVRHAERHGNADRQQQEYRDQHLREVESQLGDRGIDIAPVHRPPTQLRLACYARAHGSIIPGSVI